MLQDCVDRGATGEVVQTGPARGSDHPLSPRWVLFPGWQSTFLLVVSPARNRLIRSKFLLESLPGASFRGGMDRFGDSGDEDRMDGVEEQIDDVCVDGVPRNSHLGVNWGFGNRLAIYGTRTPPEKTAMKSPRKSNVRNGPPCCA